MTSQNGGDTTQELKPQGKHHWPFNWIASGKVDPFRAAGVPDRLVLVLNRDGINYHGTLTVWEYREIDVRRGTLQDGSPVIVQEMVVDASHPTSVEMTVCLDERPTAGLLVMELLSVLRHIAGKFPRRVVHNQLANTGCPDCECCSVFSCSTAGAPGCGRGCPCTTG